MTANSTYPVYMYTADSYQYHVWNMASESILLNRFKKTKKYIVTGNPFTVIMVTTNSTRA